MDNSLAISKFAGNLCCPGTCMLANLSSWLVRICSACFFPKCFHLTSNVRWSVLKGDLPQLPWNSLELLHHLNHSVQIGVDIVLDLNDLSSWNLPELLCTLYSKIWPLLGQNAGRSTGSSHLLPFSQFLLSCTGCSRLLVQCLRLVFIPYMLISLFTC